MVRMGVNRAEILHERFEKSGSELNRCIFLSHASKDKIAVKRIGEYIKRAGIDIYLDENDADLQRASLLGDHDAVTSCIEKGIHNSTDIFCIVSEDTKGSWWVPYEVGYGKKAEVDLYTFLLKDVSHIPSYLEICNTIKDIYDLNRALGYISKGIVKEAGLFYYGSTRDAGNVLHYDSPNHPLEEYVRKYRQ